MRSTTTAFDPGECVKVRQRTDAAPKSAQSPVYHLSWEHAMAEEDTIQRKPSGSRIKGMSLYASSADYERRLSEDIPQALEPDIVDETQVDDA
jgi:hypothetical protein